MALSPGTHLGPLDATAQIGVSGTGELYRKPKKSIAPEGSTRGILSIKYS